MGNERLSLDVAKHDSLAVTEQCSPHAAISNPNLFCCLPEMQNNISEEDIYDCSAPLPFSATVCFYPLSPFDGFSDYELFGKKKTESEYFKSKVILLSIDPQQVFTINFPEVISQATLRDLSFGSELSAELLDTRLDAAWDLFQIETLSETIALWEMFLNLEDKKPLQEAIDELMQVKVPNSSLFSPLAKDIPADLRIKQINLNVNGNRPASDVFTNFLEDDLKQIAPVPTPEQLAKLRSLRAQVLSRFIDVVDNAINTKFNGDPFLKWRAIEFFIERLGLNYNGDMLLFRIVEESVINLAHQVAKDDPPQAVLFKLEFYAKTGALDLAKIESFEAELGIPAPSKKAFTGDLDQAYDILTANEFIPPLDESTNSYKEIDTTSEKIGEMAAGNSSFAVTWSRLWTERYLRELNGRFLDLGRISGLEKRFQHVIKRCRYARAEAPSWKIESEFYLRAIYTITAVWGSKNGPMLQRLVTCEDTIVNVDAVVDRAKDMQAFAGIIDQVVPSGVGIPNHFREIVAAIYWLAYVESYSAGGLFQTAAANIELLPDKVKNSEYYTKALDEIRERYGKEVIDAQGKFWSGKVSLEQRAQAQERTNTFFLSSKSLWRETMLPWAGALVGSVGGPVGSAVGAGFGKWVNQRSLQNDPGAKRLITESRATGLSLIPENEANAREMENYFNYGMLVGLSGLGAKLNYTILRGSTKLALASGRGLITLTKNAPKFAEAFFKKVTVMPTNARLLFAQNGALGGTRTLLNSGRAALLGGVKYAAGKSWQVLATDRSRQAAALLTKRAAEKGLVNGPRFIDRLVVNFSENMAFAVHFRLLLGLTLCAVDYYVIPPRASEKREGKVRSFGLLGGFGASLWINEFVGAMLMGFNGGGSFAATLGRFGLETAILYGQGFSINNMPLDYLMVAMGLSNVIRGTNKIYVEGVPQLQKARLYRGVLKFMHKNGVEDIPVPQSVIGRSASKVKAKWSMGRLRQFTIQGPGEESSLAAPSNRIMDNLPPEGTCVGVSRYTANQQASHRMAFNNLSAGKTTAFPRDFNDLGVSEQTVRQILGVESGTPLHFYAYKGSSPRFKASVKGTGKWFIVKRDNGKLVIEGAATAPKTHGAFPEKSATFSIEKKDVQHLLSADKQTHDILYAPFDARQNRLAVSVDGRPGEIFIIKLKVDHATNGLGGPIVVERVTEDGFKKMVGFTREELAGKALRKGDGVDFIRAGYYQAQVDLGSRKVPVIRMEARQISPKNSYYASDGHLVYIDVGPYNVRGEPSTLIGRLMKKWDEGMQKTVHATYSENWLHKNVNRLIPKDDGRVRRFWDMVGRTSTASGKYIPTTMGVFANWEDLYFIYLVKSLGAPMQKADPNAVGSVEVVNYAIAQFITHRYVQGALGLDTFVGNMAGYGVGVFLGLAFLGNVFATKVNQMPDFEGVVEDMSNDDMDFIDTYEKLSSLNLSDYFLPGNRVENGLTRQLEPERLVAYRKAMFDLARSANSSLEGVNIQSYFDVKTKLISLGKLDSEGKFKSALAIFHFADSILKRLHNLAEMEDTAETSELERMLAIDICILKSLLESGDFANIRPYLLGVAKQIEPIIDALPSLRTVIRTKFLATDLDAGRLGDVVPDEIYPEDDDYPIDLNILKELH